MPHPPIDRAQDLLGNWGFDFSNDDGVTWHAGARNVPNVSSSSRYVRPASTNNPKGPNGREDAPWSASGGISVTRPTEVYRQDAPGYVIYRYFGETSPAITSAGLGVIPPVDPNLGNTAMRQCLAQFTERSVELGAAARELGSTFKMVGDAATGLAKGIDNLMAKEWKQLGRMASWKKLPSAYLQYLYGWRPVSEDISNAFDSLIDIANDGSSFELFLKKTKRAEDESFATGQIFDGTIYRELQFRITQVCRAKMKFVLPPWYFEKLPTVSPFGELYETTRASFVLDWFIPIGEWIGAFESAQLWPFFVGGTVSDKRERRLISSRVVNPSGYHVLTQRPLRITHYDYSYGRTVIDEMAEGIIFARPSLRNPLSLSHAAQGLSLLTQVFQKWQ